VAWQGRKPNTPLVSHTPLDYQIDLCSLRERVRNLWSKFLE
jgi:hypothetical protein